MIARALAIAVALGALSGIAGVAHADGPATGEEQPLADQKFEQAQKLRAAGNVAEACRLFRESLLLNANAIGTVLNVARCDEEEGKVASAYHRYADALARAIEQNAAPQREAAEQQMKALVDRIPHLTLTFAAPPPPNALIAIDGTPVQPSAAGDVMVDPGTVHVVVSAPGFVAFEAHVRIAESEHETQVIPKLVPPLVVKHTRRFVGKLLAYVGGSVAVVGLGIAIGAKVDYNNYRNGTSTVNGMAEPNCTAQRICIPSISNRLNGDYTLGNIATGIGVGGLVVGIAGAVLWALPYREHMQPVAIIPEIAPGQAGLAAVWRFR